MACDCDWKNGCCIGDAKRRCRKYKAMKQRERGSRYPAAGEQRKRAIARAKAGISKRKGKLIPLPCEICGSVEQIEMHHEDYSQPLNVHWLCRAHHILLTVAK